MRHTHKIRLAGELRQLEAAQNFVTEIVEKADAGNDVVFHCQLSIEEIFTNIVEHGYGHDGADKSIEITCEISDKQLVISVIDEAPKFNPLDLAEPDPDTPLWEREGGGWGVYFVRQYMDAVRYKFAGERNHIIMEKKLS
ncbi:MAG: ATP-binding protein [Aggregatilineales bacterium]